MLGKFAWEFLQIKTASVRYTKDNEWPERTYEDKGMLNFFSKIYKKPQVIGLRRKDLYSWPYISLTTVHSEFLQHPAGMKKMFYNILTPDVFLNHPFLEDE